MAKKNGNLVSVEVLESNSTWDYRTTKKISNFICKKDDAEKAMIDASLNELWKHEKSYSAEAKAIFRPQGTRNASSAFFGDEVSVEDVKAPKNFKPTDKFLYKLYDYTDGRLTTEYATRKDVLSYIAKRVKTKYAYATYNGNESRIEVSVKSVGDILSKLEETTSSLMLEPTGRSATTDCSIFVSVFKNLSAK